MSEQNLEYAKQVKEAVGNIRITSENGNRRIKVFGCTK